MTSPESSPASSPASASDQERPAHGETKAVTHTFHADLVCLDCADAVDYALRRTPAITDVHVAYPDRSVQVTYDAGQITPRAIQTLISTAAYGCRCAPTDTPGPAIGGGLGALAHQADMAAVTMGTSADRMQFEFPSTAAGHRHRMEHMEHEPHAAHEARTDQAAPAPGGHAAMGHDMSDPRMAKAMEADMRNRFVVALALSIPTLLVSPLAMSLFHLRLVGPNTANWLMLLFSTPVVWWAGWPFIGGAAASLRHRALNMSVLIATGVLAAWGFSVALTLTVGGETFYDASVMLVTFVLFGHWMEMKSRRGTTDALRALFDLVPPTATVLRDGVERDIPTGEIVVGDRVRLRPGDKIPVDGVVADGTTSIDEALVTGESAPVDKGPGDPVIGGSINRGGSIVMEASKVGSDTALAHIVALVERAQTSKAPGQRLADRAAAYLVVVAVGAGILTFLVWSLLAREPLLTALTFAISAVVIACPDALGLATPTAVAVGTGLGAKHNILIKDAATLEGISQITAIVLDKTGTLTEGKPRLTDVLLAGSGPWTSGQEDELLRLVASAEHGSEHPLATAIVQGATARGVTIASAEGFTAVTGKGMTARVDGRTVLVGNQALLADHHIEAGPLGERAAELAAMGKTPMYVAVDGQMAGLIAVADTVKPSARVLIPRLHEAGIVVAMMTGDNRRTAEAVAHELGIERVFAEVLPEQKAAYVRRLQEEGQRVAMVGDGVNDAPALAQADIGIAIGAGTDVAIETAKVVLMKSDPLDILRALRLSGATVTKMKQNLFWASIYNLLAIPVAAGALYPRFGLMLQPQWSALLMSLSSIIVATNAVLLKRVDGELGSDVGVSRHGGQYGLPQPQRDAANQEVRPL